MINVCSNCGKYAVKKIIDLVESTVTCPFCFFKHEYIFKTLSIVTGPSGAGKTTIHEQLTGHIPGNILLEGDIFWSGRTDGFFDLVLRTCKNIIQSNVSVVVFNSGLGVPSNISKSDESAYFRGFRYLNLTCSDETLVKRLTGRPEWRKSATEEELQKQLQFKKWLDIEHQFNTIDTTSKDITETSEIVRNWIINNGP
ncbi:MAG: hypothetical protein ABI760_15445 [Ferruginibacter sp.]